MVTRVGAGAVLQERDASVSQREGGRRKRDPRTGDREAGLGGSIDWSNDQVKNMDVSDGYT